MSDGRNGSRKVTGGSITETPSRFQSWDDFRFKVRDFYRVDTSDHSLGSIEGTRLLFASAVVLLALLFSLFWVRSGVLRPAEWTVHCADGRAARIKMGPSQDEIRFEIDRLAEPTDWNIILRRYDRIDDRSPRVVRFEARADSARDAVCAVRDFAPPWENLGLWKEIHLTPQWRSFEFTFDPPSASSMVAIEWLLGSSAIPIEIRGYSFSKRSGQADRSIGSPIVAGVP